MLIVDYLVMYCPFLQVSVHVVFCLIVGVLSLHLTFIFLGKEAKSREIYKTKCQSKFKGTRKLTDAELSNICIRLNWYGSFPI